MPEWFIVSGSWKAMTARDIWNSNRFRKFWFPFIVTMLMLLALTQPFMRAKTIRSDDLEFHGARVANYYLALRQGQLPPRWAPNLNYGFGYPMFMFTYQLPYIVAMVPYMAGLTIEMALNVVVIVSIIAGGLGMFMLGYGLTRNGWVGVIAALLYSFAPYLLATNFIRGALGEISFLGVFPWVIMIISMFLRFGERWWFILLTIGVMATVILAHPVSLMVGLAVALGWFGLQLYQHRPLDTLQRIRLLSFLLAGLVAVLITGFFWVPFIVERAFISVDNNFSVTTYWQQFPSLLDLIWSRWSYGGFVEATKGESFTKMVGIFHILLILAGLLFVLLKKGSDRLRANISYWLTVFGVAIGLMLSISRPFWDLLSFLRYMQFPWRLLWVTVLSSSVVYILLAGYSKLNRKLHYFFGGLLIGYGIYALIFIAKPIGYISNPEHMWLEYGGTGSAYGELNPVWYNPHSNMEVEDLVVLRVPKMTYLDERGNNHSADGEVTDINWTGSKMSYVIDAREDVEVLQRTMYFPGWQVKVDGASVNILYEDEEFPGRIIFGLPAGEHVIETVFTNSTQPRTWGDSITVVGIAFGIGFVSWLFYRQEIQPRLA